MSLSLTSSKAELIFHLHLVCQAINFAEKKTRFIPLVLISSDFVNVFQVNEVEKVHKWISEM